MKIDVLNIKDIPEKSGCYLYKNKNDKVIYVGKAKNLKKRVSSYFNKVHNFKTTKLVREIEKIDYFVVHNEKEAFLLEENLIKTYKPKYNIILADDKKYPYIVIENKKDPTYLYVRNYKDKYKKAYGPFPDGAKARSILYMLERIYPLKRCKLINQTYPCTYYQLNLCSGACFKEVDQKYYDQMLENVDNFFKGKTKDFKNELILKMKNSANNLNFEEANEYKKIINSLDYAISEQYIDIENSTNCVDFINYFCDENYISIVILFYQFGRLTYKQEETFKYEQQDVLEIVQSFVNQIYKKNKKPDALYVPNNFDLKNFDVNKNINIQHADSNGLSEILNLVKSNCENVLDQYKIKMKYLNNIDIFEELKNLLNLNVYPSYIEIIDIANIGSEFVTGGVVAFKNGQISHNDFRKYNIDISEKDDGSRIEYVAYKRYKKIDQSTKIFPDLIIADGGIIQVRAIKSALKKLNISIEVIGLVKNDKHKTDHIFDLNEKDLFIDKKSELFKKLSFFQDKVHEFTISNFRKRQLKNYNKDSLVDIPGLGEKTIKLIRQNYPSNNELLKALPSDLKKIIKKEKSLKLVIDFINKNIKK